MHDALKLDNQLCFRLYTASRLIIQAYTPLLNQLGLTYPQYLVLMVLWERDGQPVNDIARRLNLETNTVTPLLQRMEKSGTIVRRKGTSDRRQQLVVLTDKGRALEQRALEIVPSGMGGRLSACPLQLADYASMAEKLDAMIETLKQSLHFPSPGIRGSGGTP